MQAGEAVGEAVQAPREQGPDRAGEEREQGVGRGNPALGRAAIDRGRRGGEDARSGGDVSAHDRDQLGEEEAPIAHG